MGLDSAPVSAILDTVLRAVHALGTDTRPESVVCDGVERFLPADRCLYLEFERSSVDVIWPCPRPLELDTAVAVVAARPPSRTVPPSVGVRSLGRVPAGARQPGPRAPGDVIEVPLGARGTTSWSLLAVRAHPFTDADVAVLEFAQTSLHEFDQLLHRIRVVQPLNQLHDREDLAAAEHLTGRELEVLRLLALGLPARSIAFRIDTSPRTVHKHLGSIYRKLTVHDRLGAVNRAYELGLLRMRDSAALEMRRAERD